MAPDKDPKGAKGGDTGKTDQKGKGEQAEKGDQRREYSKHSGPTRDDHRGGRSGSESDENK